MPKGLLSFHQALEYLGVNKGELKKLIKEKRITPYKIGGTYLRFKREDLENLRSHLERKAKKAHWLTQKEEPVLIERIVDFWYFNDLYILSTLIILFLLFIIFR